jgi:hypothetical protein
MRTLNEVYSSLSTRRRYEVWFCRLGLADGSGAWWFRYLLMNPGRGGCSEAPRALPVQVWATWFPNAGKPQTFIQGFPLETLNLSTREQNPFHFRIADNAIEQDSCRGNLRLDGHEISWDLRYRSTFGVTLSNKGWIGFSRTPHSDAAFSGRITFDGRTFEGGPLGFGLQGHNCGYRHRGFWTWAHAYFPRSAAPPTTLEALVYDMPFGLTFRKAVLWHDGKQHIFRNLQELCGAGALARESTDEFQWNFQCSSLQDIRLEATFDGRGESIHRLPYMKTDCTGTFKVTNNSLAKCVLLLHQPDKSIEQLQTATGAVLEIAGRR